MNGGSTALHLALRSTHSSAAAAEAVATQLVLAGANYNVVEQVGCILNLFNRKNYFIYWPITVNHSQSQSITVDTASD